MTDVTDVTRTSRTGDAPRGSSSLPLGPPVDADARAAELAEVRRLLVGEERARLDALVARMDAELMSPERMAEQLPEAIMLRAAQDKQLARALAPTVEGAISESVRRKPGEFADAIFPVLGPAIRKAIAETMSELVGSINRAMQHSFSARGLSWRIESWRTGVPYAQVVIKHALIYRVEQVLLVHKETGLLLQQAHLANLDAPDADLVSGMLTAIRDFVGDSFATEKDVGGLRTFSVGELTVMVEPGPKALLAAVVRGQAPASYLQRLQETIEGVHAQFATALAEYDGDTALFEPAKPLLEDCLVTVLDTDQPAGAKVNWVPWAAAGATLLLALVAWSTWREIQFRRGVTALRATPGLVVVEAEKGWRRHTYRGLRDPDASSPSVVLHSAGLDTTRTVQAWEPYLSLQPAPVMKRSLRALGALGRGAPVASQVALHGDTLALTGRVDAIWLTHAIARTSWPAGVSTLDASGATPGVPASLAAAADSLVQSRVLFAPASAVLDDAAIATIRAAARQVMRLRDALGPQGVTTRLTLIGRSDATGDEATNASLSWQRADILRKTLMRVLGLAEQSPSVTLDPKGVGTSEPIAALDSASRARLNRSVS